MAYQANIPQPTDLLSQSQSDLLNNFQALQTLIDINHVDFASGDQGKHKWVTFPVQAAIPPAGSGFLAGELGLYNAVNATTTHSELYINKTNQITVVQVPMTASSLSTNSAPASNGGFWTYLPSGLVLIGGNGGPSSGLTTVTLTVGPALTQILTVLVCPAGGGTSDVNFAVRLVDITSPSTFRIYVSPRTTVGSGTGAFQFLAIGY